MGREAVSCLGWGIAVGLFAAAFVGLSFLHERKVRQGRLMACASNFKAIAEGLASYEEDNDGVLPSAERAARGTTWQTDLWPYIKYMGCFRCPSRIDPGTGDCGFPISYAVNMASGNGKMADRGPFAVSSAPVGLKHFPAPEQVIAICEVEGTARPVFDIDDPSFGPKRQILYAGHTGRSIYMFLDGHVRTLTPTETAQGSATGTSTPENMWYSDGTKPLSNNGMRILAKTEKTFANVDDENTDND